MSSMESDAEPDTTLAKVEGVKSVGAGARIEMFVDPIPGVATIVLVLYIATSSVT